jgi:hypothetical protein
VSVGLAKTEAESVIIGLKGDVLGKFVGMKLPQGTALSIDNFKEWDNKFDEAHKLLAECFPNSDQVRAQKDLLKPQLIAVYYNPPSALMVKAVMWSSGWMTKHGVDFDKKAEKALDEAQLDEYRKDELKALVRSVFESMRLEVQAEKRIDKLRRKARDDPTIAAKILASYVHHDGQG